jgi:hypothetical protein
VRAGTTSPALFSQVDLLATLASLTGVEPAPDAAPDSRPLLPALLGRSATRPTGPGGDPSDPGGNRPPPPDV